MLLLIVRHGAHRSFHFLRETFAGEPVYILWDRRLRERRGSHQPQLDERRERHSDRRAPESPLSLRRLAFIAIPSAMAVTGTHDADYRRRRLFQ